MIKKIKLSELPPSNQIYHREAKGDKYDWSGLKANLKDGYLSNSFTNEYIRVTKFGDIFNGNHRLTILREMYVEDIEILVDEVGWIDSIVFRFFEFAADVFRHKSGYGDEIIFKDIKLIDLSDGKSLRNLNYIKRKNPSTLYYSEWDELTKSLYEKGYDGSDNTCIEIDQHNNILDGYKRAHLLIRKYGNNLKIRVKVKQKLYKKRINVKMFILLFIITLILTLILISILN